MTQMQSPYEESNVTLHQESERTSVMAILSMVFGIGGCCLGITSIPAILLGIFGLVGIAKSKGRVGGTGFGIAGILIGLLTLAMWGGLLGAVSFGLKQSFVPMSDTSSAVLLDIQSDQFDSARGLFAGWGETVSDEALIAFREGYRSTLGDFVSKPDGLGEWIEGYMATGESMGAYPGRQDLVPLPMRFDSGWGLVMYQIESQPQGFPEPMTLIVIDPDGNVYQIELDDSLIEIEEESADLPGDLPTGDPSDDSVDDPADDPADDSADGP